MTDTEFATVSSIYTLGGLIGALSAGPLSSKRGRLLPMRITTPFHIVGSLMEALSPNIPVIAIGRFLSGIGSGASLVVVPIYISEVSPSNTKGALGAFTQILTNVGILFSQIMGYFLSYNSMWRVVLGTGVILGIIQFALLLFVVESPEWLGANGRTNTAWKNIKKIRGKWVEAEETRKWAPADHTDGMFYLSILYQTVLFSNSGGV
jgi:MFS family permease